MSTSSSDRSLLRMAALNARFGGWYIDLDSRRITLSDELTALMGYLPLGSLSGGDATGDTISQHSLARQIGLVDAVDQFNGEPFDYHRQVVDDRGRVLDIRTIGEPVRDDGDRLIGIQGAFFDVTELVLSERAHRTAEARFGATFDTMTDGIMLLDHDWTITYVNPRGGQLMHRTPGELVGKLLSEVAPATLDSRHGDAFRRAIAEHSSVTARDYVERIDRWIEVTAYPVGDGLAVFFCDVTDDERATKLLRESELRVAAQAELLDLTSDVIIVRDLQGTIEHWNEAAVQLFSWSVDEAIGQSVGALLARDSIAFREANARVLADGAWAGELEHFRRDGTKVLLDARWTKIPHFIGDHPSVLTVATDITDRRRLERERHRAERMESIGTFASGVAHDLNNVLTPILMAVQLLSKSETDSSRAALLNTMETSVKHGADMVRQVVSFARGVESRREPVGIGWLLGETLAYCTGVLPASVNVVTDVAAPLWQAVGDPTQLQQVLSNLVSNAKDAMPDGGTLTMRARNDVFADGKWTVGHLAAAGNYVVIEIEDSGAGIPEDVVAKIFEPFFTTKPKGLGTGLGLATSMGIVRSHGGYIQVYTEEGRGSRFSVYIPAVVDTGESPATTSDARADGAPRGVGQLVLIVDDESAIRLVLQQALESSGYETIMAINGSDAIRVVESSSDPVDLIITDVKMPVLDGAGAIRYFAVHHPTIPIIAASGLPANEDVARSASSGVRAFLSKPFSARELLVAVDEALRLEDRST